MYAVRPLHLPYDNESMVDTFLCGVPWNICLFSRRYRHLFQDVFRTSLSFENCLLIAGLQFPPKRDNFEHEDVKTFDHVVSSTGSSVNPDKEKTVSPFSCFQG